VSKEERNKRVVMEYLGALETGDSEQFLRYVAPDATFHVEHEVWSGHEGFKRATTIAARMYPSGLETEIQSFVADGDEVVLRVTGRTDNYYGIGEKYENYYALAFKLNEDGLIAMQHDYLDTAYANELAARADG
jgi:ketosteroid isomerase-like protein